jgi:hypothetical protein
MLIDDEVSFEQPLGNNPKLQGERQKTRLKGGLGARPTGQY